MTNMVNRVVCAIAKCVASRVGNVSYAQSSGLELLSARRMPGDGWPIQSDSGRNDAGVRNQSESLFHTRIKNKATRKTRCAMRVKLGTCSQDDAQLEIGRAGDKMDPCKPQLGRRLAQAQVNVTGADHIYNTTRAHHDHGRTTLDTLPGDARHGHSMYMCLARACTANTARYGVLPPPAAERRLAALS